MECLEKMAENQKSRQTQKAQSRQSDKERLETGEDPNVIQRENSIFPEGYFKDAKIENLKDAVGK